MSYVMGKLTGKMISWAYRVLMIITLFFMLLEIVEGIFFHRYAIISRHFWETYAQSIFLGGLIGLFLYYILLWFYPPARPWWDRLFMIILVFSLLLFNPLAKG
jgi:hypothetical protein